MFLNPAEVDTIKVIGNLNGEPVKLIRMKGGFFVASGHSRKNSKEASPLSAGSHPGIILHQLEKEFKSDFTPTMAKSEIEDLGNVRSLSAFIPTDFTKKGYDMFSLEKSGQIEYIVTKYNLDVASVSLYKNTQEFTNVSCKDFSMQKEFANWLAIAMKNG